MSSEMGQAGSKHQFGYFLAASAWSGALVSCFRFLICKIGTVIICLHRVFENIKGDTSHKLGKE